MQETNTQDDSGQPEENYLLSLTEQELFYLEDMMQMAIVLTDPSGNEASNSVVTMRPNTGRIGISVPFSLIQKVGKAILYFMDDETDVSEVPLVIEGDEIWVMREIARGSRGQVLEPLLRSLKHKIYYAVFGVNYERDKSLQKMLSGVDFSGLNTIFNQPTTQNTDFG